MGVEKVVAILVMLAAGGWLLGQLSYRYSRRNDTLNITSNKKKRCYTCGVLITDENDSGWEVFTREDASVTQPECQPCFEESQEMFEKEVTVSDG